MSSSRTAWLVGVLILSAAGLLAAGLNGLWQGLREAEATAQSEARRRANATAAAIRGLLVDPEFVASLDEASRFELLANRGVKMPERLGAISAAGVEDAKPFDWRVDATLRAAARIEHGEVRAEEAHRTLTTAASRDDIPAARDRARLLLGAAWVALRREDTELARGDLRAARRLRLESELAATEASLDAALLEPEFALAIHLGLPWTEDMRRDFGLLPAPLLQSLRLNGLLERIPADVAADLRAREAERACLARITAAEPELRASRGRSAIRRGTEVWLWEPAPDLSGRVTVLEADRLPLRLAPYVDLAGLRLDDAGAAGLRDPIPVAAGLVIEPQAAAAESSEVYSVILPILGLALVFVGTLFATLRAVREEARAAATRAEFTTMVTHELKTPLASIRLLAEMLEDDRVPDETRRREYYQRLSGESARLGMLVENVLDLGRLEKGERAYDRRETRPDEVVADTLALFRPLADRDGLSIHCQLAAGSAPALADRGALAQVLLNLLENARKYALAGGRLEVESRIADGVHRLRVRDHGPGLVEDERERIFDRFVRGSDQADGSVPGVGLGLYLARRILRDHGGDLRAEAPLKGSGLVLVWELPLAEPGEAA